MSTDKRIFFCIGSLEVGGAEKQLVLLVEALQARGWQCDVAVLEGGGELTGRLLASGARIHRFGFRTGRGLLIILEIFKSLWQAFWLIRKHRYPVVHGYLPLANFILALPAWICRVPIILTSKRALGTHQDRHPLWRFFEKIANACSDLIVANSEGVRQDVLSREGVSASEVTVIYNGLDMAAFNQAAEKRELHRLWLRREFGLPEDTLVLTMVANLIPYKGHADVIRAAALLSAGANLTFVFIGEDRGIQADLEALAGDLGLKNIYYLGRRDDVPKLLVAADIGLVASHEEGFCNALLEQMAASLPVVATEVGGNAEALNHGEFGSLINACAPAEIAAAITDLAVNPERRSELGGRARERVASLYSVAAMAEQHEKLYLNS